MPNRMLLMLSMEIFVMYILIFQNKLGRDAFPCKFIQGEREEECRGRGKNCQIMHNCSIVDLISTSSSVLCGH